MIIKTYQKSHIAHLFSPNLSQESANRRLRRWINGDQKLCEELRKVGFFDHQRDHFFTKKEVELLFEYIGEPCKWLNINILNNSKVSRCQGVKVSKCQTHFGRQKFPLINNIFKIYYLLELKMTLSQQFDTLTLWHFDTLYRKIGMPTDNPGYEYKTFIKYYKRVWRQDAFTPFFIVHHSATIVIYSSHYWANGEFQRKTEKNREI